MPGAEPVAVEAQHFALGLRSASISAFKPTRHRHGTGSQWVKANVDGGEPHLNEVEINSAASFNRTRYPDFTGHVPVCIERRYIGFADGSGRIRADRRRPGRAGEIAAAIRKTDATAPKVCISPRPPDRPVAFRPAGE